MDEKYIQLVYNALAKKYGASNIMSYDDFATQLSTNETFQKNTYNKFAEQYGADKILPYDQFQDKVKKKVGGEDSGTSTSQPSELPSNGTATTPVDFGKIRAMGGSSNMATPQQKKLVQYGANVEKAKEESPEKRAEEAAVNSTMDLFNNNPSLLSGKNFNINQKKYTGNNKFSLEQIKNFSPFQQNVADLKNKILNGELITAHGNDGKIIAARDVSGLANLAAGVKDAWNANKEANTYEDLSVDDKIKKALETKPNEYLPSVPNQNSGLYQTGAAVPSLAKFTGGLATGAVMEAAIPESGGTSLGLSPLVGWLMSVPDMAKQGRMNAEIDAIKKLKEAHPDWNNQQIYGEAQKAGLIGYTEGLATGTALNFIGSSLPPNVGQGLWKATGQFLRNQPQSVAEISGLSALTTYGAEKGKQAIGIPITDAEAWDKAGQSMKSSAIMQLAFNIGHGVISAPKYVKAQSFQALSNVSPEQLQEMQQKAVEIGLITQEQADKTTNDINDFKEAGKKIIATGNQEKDAVLKGLVQKKINLEKAKAEADKSFHPMFDTQIEAADKRIQIAQNSSDPIKYAEQDDLDGKKNFNPKPFDELSKKEVEGIATEIPKEYGDAEVEEVGGGEGAERKYKANPTVNRQQGFIKIKDKVPVEDKVYNDKEDAVRASEKALAQHYYEHGMDESLKPENKKQPEPTVEQPVSSIEDEKNVVNLPSNESEKENISQGQNKSDANNIRPLDEKNIKQKLNEIEDVTDPYDKVMHYFANDGKIHSSAIQELFGNKRGKSVENERRSRISILGKDAPSIDKLAHDMWESDQTGKYTTMDYKQAIENVLGDFNSKHAMAKDLIERYDIDAAYQRHLEKHGQDFASVYDNLSEDEMNHILETHADEIKHQELSDYIDNLIHENETKAQAQAKEPIKQAMEGSDQSNEPIPTSESSQAETTIPTTTQTENIGGQDASSIESPTTVGEQSSGTQSIGGGRSEGVGQSEQRTELTRAQDIATRESINDEIPPGNGQEKVGIHVQYPATSLKYSETARLREEHGFPEREETVTKHDIETEKEADDLLAKGWSVHDTLSKMEEGTHIPSDAEYINLTRYAAELNDRLHSMKDPASPEYDKTLKELRRVVDLTETEHGRAAGRSLGIRSRYKTVAEGSYADFMLSELDANNGAYLTNNQKAKALTDYTEFQKAKQDYEEQISKLATENAKLKAEKEFQNEVKKSKPSTAKTSEEKLKAADEKIKKSVEGAREALKKLRTGESGLSAVPLPGIRELIAIAPHVKDALSALVEKGIIKLSDAVKALHEEFKEFGVSEKNIHDIIAGNYNQKKQTKTELAIAKENLRIEAQLINKLDALLNGETPKDEKKLQRRNQEIEALRNKIKDFKKEESEAEKFYGESDAAERKLDKLRDELDRINQRRKKEKPAKNSDADKEMSSREKQLRSDIEEAQAKWDEEKKKAAEAVADYRRMETERNRQLDKIETLKAKIEQLESGVKSVTERDVKKDVPEIEALKKEAKEAEKKFNETVATEKRIRDKEAELQRLKDRKDKEPTEKGKKEISDREKELNEQIKSERKSIAAEEKEANTFYREVKSKEQLALERLKARNKKQTQRIQEKIDKGDFAPDEKKTPLTEQEEVKQKFPQLYKDVIDSIDALIKKRKEIQIRRAKQMHENQTDREKFNSALVRGLNVPRTLMASMDFSAPLRQGIVASISHPILAKRAAKFMFEATKDEKIYNRWLDEVHENPMWEDAEKSGLAVTDPATLHLKEKEEAFLGSSYAEQIPVVGGLVKGSERAYIGFLNKIRWDLYTQYATEFRKNGYTYQNSPDMYKGLASYVNSATGRGGMAKFESAAPVLNIAIFSPRLIASRMNMLGLTDIPNLLVQGVRYGIKGATLGKFDPKWRLDYGFYSKLPPKLRVEAAKDMLKFVAVGITTLALAKAMGAEVEADPRSSDFGKIKSGNTRWDIWGGFQPYARLLSQIVTGQSKSAQSGKVYELDGSKYGGKTIGDQLASFGRGKLAPIPSMAIDILTQRNQSQQTVNRDFGLYLDDPKQTSITWEVLQHIFPLLFQDVYQAMKDKGVSALFTAGIPSVFGVGVQTYDQKKPVATSSHSTHHKSAAHGHHGN